MADYSINKPRRIDRIIDQHEHAEQVRTRIEQSKRYLCTSCSNCTVEPHLCTAEEYGILDNLDVVTHVVDAVLYCPVTEHKPKLVPKLHAKVLCSDGNKDRTETCANCRHGHPITCRIQAEDPNLKHYVQLYLCRNPSGNEHCSKGTARRPYIGCEHFEPK